MPTLASAQKTIRSFLGVNLRRDRLDLEDYELAKAINADLHSMLGSISLRLGRTSLFSSSLGGSVRRMGKVNSIRYQVANQTLYRNQSSISTSLSANKITTIGSYRPLSDATLWAFIADDAQMKKDDGTNLRNWGIVAPTVAPSVTQDATGGSLTAGTYQVQYTYVRKSGSTVACESNPSPAGSAVSSGSDSLDIVVTPSTDPQVTKVRLYRTISGGSDFLYLGEYTNDSSIKVNGASDSSLGAEVETDHDPPVNAHWFTVWNDSGWLLGDVNNPDWLYFSNRFLPEYFPPEQYLELGDANDPLQCAVPSVGMLGVFSRKTKYRIVGNILSGYVGIEAISRRGTMAPNAVINSEQGIIFPASDGVFISSLSSPDISISADIDPLIFGESVNDFNAVNWSAASTMASGYYKGRYYWAYPSGSNTTPDIMAVYSFDTKKWYFYQIPMQSILYEEDTDQFIGGGTDGVCYQLEDGATDNGSDIAMTVETKDYTTSDPDVRRIYQFFKVDADCFNDTLNVEIFIDNVSKGQYAITGSRTKIVENLPEGSMGFTHRFKFTYTGSSRIRIYGVQMISVPLGAS